MDINRQVKKEILKIKLRDVPLKLLLAIALVFLMYKLNIMKLAGMEFIAYVFIFYGVFSYVAYCVKFAENWFLGCILAAFLVGSLVSVSHVLEKENQQVYAIYSIVILFVFLGGGLVDLFRIVKLACLSVKRTKKISYESEPKNENYQEEQHGESASGNEQPDIMKNLFDGCRSKDSLTRRYRALMKTFHPDNQDGDTHMTQVIQNTYEELLKKYE